MTDSDWIALGALIVSGVAAIASVLGIQRSDHTLRQAEEESGRSLKQTQELADRSFKQTQALADQTLHQAERHFNANEAMFKRQSVIDLHNAWTGTNQIDVNNLIGPDVQKAANAIALTASLWLHDVVDKEILFQSYWDAYKEIYDTLHGSNARVPGYTKTCRDFISPEVAKVYEDMKAKQLNSVVTTTIRG